MAATYTEGFVDRTDAGEQLARALRIYRGQHPLVLAIPRGGVPVGRVIADALDGELDVSVEGRRHSLRPGDCLRYQLFGASTFETPAHCGARYVLFMV